MSTAKKICVVTGTRAEYGLLKWTMKAIADHSDMELQVIATAMHLCPEFGNTYKEIENDGFTIDRKVEILLSSDTAVGVSKSVGLGVMGFADEYERLRPDLILLLGDRFEILAAAIAATIARIPIAHCHGGEATEGLIDEPIRHSITKMSHLHFASTDDYKKRIIQLGEQPDRVFNVGAFGLEAVSKLKLMEREELENDLGFKFGEQNFLLTYHPVTLLDRSEKEAFSNVLFAMEQFPTAKFIITYPNADPSGRDIINLLREFAEDRKEKVYLTESLGQLRYLSTIQYMDAVIGNSSSGLIEVPSFNVPTVNIGIRQRGRVAPDTVIHCDEDQQSILQAIEKALSSEFREFSKTVKNPYGNGTVSQKIMPILENVELSDIVIKKFNDLEN